MSSSSNYLKSILSNTTFGMFWEIAISRIYKNDKHRLSNLK